MSDVKSPYQTGDDLFTTFCGGNALWEFYEQSGVVMKDLQGAIETADYLGHVGLEQEVQDLYGSEAGSLQTILLRRHQKKLKQMLEEAWAEAKMVQDYALTLERTRRAMGVYDKAKRGE